jgi:hypothetical protein
MNNINNPDNPVILFIPETGIYPYMRGLAVLGDAVRRRGGRVLVTRDSGQMLRSPIMAMRRISANPSEAEKIIINKANDKVLRGALRKYKFPIIELSNFVDDQLIEEINNIGETYGQSLEDIKFRGFSVGKIAQYDFILETKTPYSSEISEEQRALYLAYIKNTALTVAITENICERLRPSLIINFNEYAQCQAVRYVAELNNVPRMGLSYPVHLGIDTSRFIIGKSVIGYYFFSHCQNWPSVKDTPIAPNSVKACWDDTVFRLFGAGGSHIFSGRKDSDPEIILNKLRLDPRKKTIVAYTSSIDERQGVNTMMEEWRDGPKIVDAFPDQISWLFMLRDYVTNRSDLQVVVRVHPREGSRQFGFDSPHLKQLKAVFSKNTENFIIVWPDTPISSYDLMELADVCLVSWSTIGQEAARLGIPTLASASNMSYPDDDFIQVAITKEEYKKRLDSILKMNYSWKHLVKAVRYYHWRTFIPSLDLGETVPTNFDYLIWPEAPDSKVNLINDILSGKQNIIEYNIKKWQASLPADAEIQESEAMRHGIRNFLDEIFYPPILRIPNSALFFRAYRKGRKILTRLLRKKNIILKSKKSMFKDYNLEFSSDVSRLEELCQKTRQDKNLRILVTDGRCVILINRGKLLRRMSPMLVHLAKLYALSLK